MNGTKGRDKSAAGYLTTTSGMRLPADLVHKAMNRLGMVGLLSAAAQIFLHYESRFVVPVEVLQAKPVGPAYLVAMWVAIGSGIAIYGLTRSRKLPAELMLDIGLIFEVIVAICIGVIEASHFSAGAHLHFGPSGIAVWIIIFALVIPNTPYKTALAALSSAFMAPVALLVAAYANGEPPPPASLFLVVSFPNFMCAAIAIILSRFVYSLGREVSRARAMGSYKLVELLGSGGMGEVWRAQHQLLARPAAIKLIQPGVLGFASSEATALVKRRFEREAQATAMLSSPHTINLYDFGQSEDGAFYYVMELLHGIDLRTLVERYGPMPADRTAYFLDQICASLEEAHESGLVHRDIKPANVYICRYGLEYDFIKVLDFGVVKSKVFEQTLMTTTNAAAGTPGFMAPEMVLGKDVDARADIYAVGCVGYWLLTGRLVFEEETHIATMLAHANKLPIPPSWRTEIVIPPQLEKLIMSCLEKSPQARPATAGEIRRAIRRDGLADSWVPEAAEKWWKLHAPEQTRVRAPIQSKQRVLPRD